MKKLVVVQATALALLMAVGSASAEDSVPPVSEMPLDQGIVIDTTSGQVDTTAAVETTTTPAVDQGTEDAAANDGTVLPLDQGDINASEIDAGGQAVQVETATPEVTAPEKDTVVLTEKQPVVEPLPKTGIADNGLLYAGLAGLLGVIALVVTRFRKAEQV